MSRSPIVFALGAIVMMSLAACGDPHKAKLVASCEEDDGMDKKTCLCVAEKLEANLSKDTYKSVARAAAAKEGEDTQILESLPELEQMALGVAMMDATATCSGLLGE